MINDSRRLPIQWEWIENDHPKPKEWIDSWQCERFVKTYLAKHPEKISPGAILAGIEVEIPNECFDEGFNPSSFLKPRANSNQKADLVFIRDKD